MGTSASDDRWLAEYKKLKGYSLFRSFDPWKFRALRFTSLVPGRQAAICDFGAGEGRALLALQRLGYSNLHALDTRNVLRPELKDRVGFTEGDLANLEGIAAESFDAAYVFEALHHLPDRQACLQALAGIRRTLKPGGLLFLYEPVLNLPTRLQYALVRRKALHFIPLLKTMAALLRMEERELFAFYGYMDGIGDMLGSLGYARIMERNFLNHRLWAACKEAAGRGGA